MRKNILIKYCVELEDILYNFINKMEINKNDEKNIEKEINKIKSSSIYQKIRWDKADQIEQLRIMNESNNFISSEENIFEKKGT